LLWQHHPFLLLLPFSPPLQFPPPSKVVAGGSSPDKFLILAEEGFVPE